MWLGSADQLDSATFVFFLVFGAENGAKRAGTQNVVNVVAGKIVVPEFIRSVVGVPEKIITLNFQ